MSTHRMQRTVLTVCSLLAVGTTLSVCATNDSPGPGGAGDGSSPPATDAEPNSRRSGTTSARAGTASAGATRGKVSGTVTGRLRYFTQRGFTVTTADKRTLGFSMAVGTEITGRDTVCGQPDERIACTEKQLVSWTKSEKVFARVTLNGGVATDVGTYEPGTADGAP
jgi:hypothetical protein